MPFLARTRLPGAAEFSMTRFVHFFIGISRAPRSPDNQPFVPRANLDFDSDCVSRYPIRKSVGPLDGADSPSAEIVVKTYLIQLFCSLQTIEIHVKQRQPATPVFMNQGKCWTGNGINTAQTICDAFYKLSLAGTQISA